MSLSLCPTVSLSLVLLCPSPWSYCVPLPGPAVSHFQAHQHLHHLLFLFSSLVSNTAIMVLKLMLRTQLRKLEAGAWRTGRTPLPTPAPCLIANPGFWLSPGSWVGAAAPPSKTFPALPQAPHLLSSDTLQLLLVSTNIVESCLFFWVCQGSLSSSGFTQFTFKTAVRRGEGENYSHQQK